MTDEALQAIAHRRALMLGSSQFPPGAHLAYLRRGGRLAASGLAPAMIENLILRDVQLPAERVELIRVIAETLLVYGQVGTMLEPEGQRRIPGLLEAAPLTWFGIEREGRLLGLHGGFFWSETLWIRRFYAVVDDHYPWSTHFRIEAHIYGHLWDLGMREAMIQVPAGTPNLDARRAAGWQASHEVHFQWNRRPFIWLAQRFAFRPGAADPLPADATWQAET